MFDRHLIELVLRHDFAADISDGRSAAGREQEEER
jgi:hypothetical protein